MEAEEDPVHVAGYAWEKMCGHGGGMMRANNACGRSRQRGSSDSHCFARFGSRLGVRMGQNWSPMVPIGKGKVEGVSECEIIRKYTIWGLCKTTKVAGCVPWAFGA